MLPVVELVVLVVLGVQLVVGGVLVATWGEVGELLAAEEAMVAPTAASCLSP